MCLRWLAGPLHSSADDLLTLMAALGDTGSPIAAALPTMLETRRQGPGFQQALGWMLDLPLGASEWVKVARDELRQLLAGSGRSLA